MESPFATLFLISVDGNIDRPANGAIGRIRRAGAAIEDNELDQLPQIVDPMPGFEAGQIVRADEVKEFRAAVGAARIPRSYRWRTTAAAAAVPARRLRSAVLPPWPRAASPAGAQRAVGFVVELVRRDRGRNEDHLLEFQLLDAPPARESDGHDGSDRRSRHKCRSSSTCGTEPRQRVNGQFAATEQTSAGLISSRLARFRASMKPDQLGQLLLTGVPGTEIDAATAGAVSPRPAGRLHLVWPQHHRARSSCGS